MAQFQYSRAPITEAIIDLRLKLPKDASLAQLEECGKEEAERYPEKSILKVGVSHVEMGESLKTSASSREIGFLFRSKDAKQIFQVHLEGFTVNRLAPYVGWEAFRDEARRLWRLYRKIARPVQLDRVAVRYINRLDLPLPIAELKEYLRTVPEVSPGLPQTLANYFMHLNIPFEDLKLTLVLNQTVVAPPDPSRVSIALDIDLYRTEELTWSDEWLWETLEKLHVRKNEIFEACITDKTRELIK